MAREVIIGGALLLNIILFFLFLTAIWLLRSKRPKYEPPFEHAEARQPANDPGSLFAYDSWSNSDLFDGADPSKSQFRG